MDLFMDILKDAALDTVRLIPFLFVTYLLMEYMEHKTGDRIQRLVKRAGKLGPIAGGSLGVFPQCGFSASAASLYAGRLITVGTLLAVFLSTSDEMLPILLSAQAEAGVIVKILLIKMVIGIITGLLIDQVLVRFLHHPQKQADIHGLCEHEHCHCESHSVFYSAMVHTVQIVIYIFLFSAVLNGVIEWIGEEALSGLLLNVPVAGQMLAALVGLIPNCAASVVITQMYLEGLIGGGAMMAGLLVSAGVGLLILFRLHDDRKKSLQILGLLYGSGVFWGLVIQFTGIL